MQFKILPLISGIANVEGGVGAIEGIGIGVSGTGAEDLSNSFLYLLLIQGFFSGLAIGKLAEGNLNAGIKHSFALILISFLIFAGTNLIFG